MARPDVTAAFILSASVAILASEQVGCPRSLRTWAELTIQERTGHNTLLPPGTSHLAGHGFIGTLTALVVAGRLDLQTGVRLAASLSTADLYSS
jgi:hypothetical protein